MAEQDSGYPGITRRTGAGSMTLGETTLKRILIS